MKLSLPLRIVLLPFRILLFIPVMVAVLVLVLIGENEEGMTLFYYLITC